MATARGLFINNFGQFPINSSLVDVNPFADAAMSISALMASPGGAGTGAADNQQRPLRNELSRDTTSFASDVEVDDDDDDVCANDERDDSENDADDDDVHNEDSKLQSASPAPATKRQRTSHGADEPDEDADEIKIEVSE